MQQQSATTQIRKFELTAKLADGGKCVYDYERDEDETTAKVKMKDKNGKKTKQTDRAGVEASERLLSEMRLNSGMSQGELLNRTRAALHRDESAIKSLEVEVEFADGTELEAEEGD